MATFEIKKVHTEQPTGYSHEHIEQVELGHGSRLRRSTVVADIRNPYGDRYYTYGSGLRADVVVRDCPHRCGFGDYITTLPDATKENNLLKLPRF